MAQRMLLLKRRAVRAARRNGTLKANPLPKGLPPRAALGLFLFAALAFGGEPTERSQPGSLRTGFEEECSRCRSTGRVTCPTCRGAGNVRKECPVCGGKGRRPCPQCAAPGPGPQTNRTTPGKVVCSACGGKGTTEGAPDRPCLRCRGAKELPCPVCFGRGDVSCPKTRYQKTCPTCGFVGTVPCPECKGTGFRGEGEVAAPFSPGPEATDLPQGDGASGESPPRDAETPSASKVGAGGYSQADYEADHLAVANLWGEFSRQYRSLEAHFVPGPFEEVREARSDAGRLYRSALECTEEGRADAGDLARKIREAQKELDALDRLGGNLFDRFEGLRKTSRRLHALWEGQPQWAIGLRAEDQEEIQRKIGDLRQLLTAAQKSAVALTDQKPEGISARLKTAKALTGQLRQALEKMKSAAAKSKKNVPAGTRLLARAEGSPPPSDLLPKSESKPGEPDPLERPPRRTSDPPRPEQARTGARSEPPRAVSAGKPEPRGAGEGLAVFLGVLAVAFCSAGYFVLHQKK
jgi:hypothetical protein